MNTPNAGGSIANLVEPEDLLCQLCLASRGSLMGIEPRDLSVRPGFETIYCSTHIATIKNHNKQPSCAIIKENKSPVLSAIRKRMTTGLVIVYTALLGYKEVEVMRS